MAYPENDDFFGILEPCDELGVLGEGFPVFFYLVQYLTYLLLVINMVFFLPTVFFMKTAYERVKNQMTLGDDFIGLFSFGVFIKYNGSDASKLSIFEDN